MHVTQLTLFLKFVKCRQAVCYIFTACSLVLAGWLLYHGLGALLLVILYISDGKLFNYVLP